MKRREFIRSTAFAGATGLLGNNCSPMKSQTTHSGPGFDIHPFIKNHPEAVFVSITDIKDKGDSESIRKEGKSLAEDIIVPVMSGGYTASTRVIVKPNWTGARPMDGKPVFEKLGVNTDPYFIEGWITGMRRSADCDFYIRESGSPHFWKDMGYYTVAERIDVNLRDLSSMDMWELKKGKDLNFVEIPDGVVFRETAYMAPVNEPGTFLVNIAKFKAHGMGITASVKNIQGLCPKTFKQFCTRYDTLRETYDKRYHIYFKRDFEKHIEALYRKHLDNGIPRWDKPGENGGIWMEQWVNRMLDSYTVTRPALSIVEGIYSQDGTGFGIGPHEPSGKYGITSRDYMSNVLLFGLDPFRIDIVTHWLAGHEPGNFGLFHIGIERGFSDVLDPHDIPVYLWKDGQAIPAKLSSLPRTPLVTYYLQRDYAGQKEPRFHLCDEPFDYSAWKLGARAGECTPAITELGSDRNGNIVMEMSVTERTDAYVEVLNSRGERLWRLMADGLEPGVHQVVWDGFASPGLYNFYVKGMGWDAERKVVMYSS